MKKISIVFLVLISIISYSIAEDDLGLPADPGMDMGMPGDAGIPGGPADLGMPSDPSMPGEEMGMPGDAPAEMPGDLNAGMPTDPGLDAGVPGDLGMDPGAGMMPGDMGMSPEGSISAPEGMGEPATPAPDGAEMLPGEGGMSPDANMAGETPGAVLPFEEPSKINPESETPAADIGMPDAGIDSALGEPEASDPVTDLPPMVPAKKAYKKTSSDKNVINMIKSYAETNDLWSRKDGDLGEDYSLRGVIEWDVSSSSAVKGTDVKALNDNNKNTALIIDMARAGQMPLDNFDTQAKKNKKNTKEFITLSFNEENFWPLFEIDAKPKIKLTAIKMLNGDCTSEENWRTSARARVIRVYKNKTPVCYVLLSDNMRWQTAKFDKPVWVSPGDKIKAEILTLYPVRNNDKLVITELTLIGDHPKLSKLQEDHNRF